MIPPRRKLDFWRLLLILIFLLQAVVFFRNAYQSKDKDKGEGEFIDKVSIIDKTKAKAQGRTISSAYNPSAASNPKARKIIGTKFAVGSMSDRETSYDHLAISNKMRYTQKHGYDMIWSFEKAEGSYPKDWDRLNEMERAIKAKHRGENAYEWIWWTDFDLIVTNSSITLESMVELALEPYSAAERDQIDMIITPDCFPVNSGSLMVRTTPYILEVIKEWWRQKEIPGEEGDPRSLQDCLRDMVATGTMGLDKKSTFVKQWQLNAFPPEIKCHQDHIPWQPGFFVIHFAGAWAHVDEPDPTGLLMRKYAPYAV
ncbi:unnamed protein product [Zymoseptoria tritici ST99CH_3D7]|uniref:Galactosyl transferase GMA12/MNN10 family protein n=2 Tax=Zymoseptoria tritici TaxID=1047171 RepID=A0A1X7RCH8_ZYMT9|nr:unnamed protein product [Zymoseptoria tritici ST99CH_3D7]SMR41488.1 unnamed protein product [Zymoseptoria tritici ST99CH_1E4]